MIRSFTIVENRIGDGKVGYTVSGNLPIEEAARALVVIALQVVPQVAKKKGD